MSDKTKEKVTISCAGCGRTQTLRMSKVIPCNYYTCGFDCNANPDWNHPNKLQGFVHAYHYHAAGGFTGHEIRSATDEEQLSINRAKSILASGLRQNPTSNK